jgi:hypothetical protein
MAREAIATGAGRMLGISLHPWLTGQPHRIGCVERVVAHLMANHDKIWFASAGQIVETFNKQQQSS